VSFLRMEPLYAWLKGIPSALFTNMFVPLLSYRDRLAGIGERGFQSPDARDPLVRQTLEKSPGKSNLCACLCVFAPVCARRTGRRRQAIITAIHE